ncbi:MAG: serine hydrolase [Saprospiraceae bacterium]|nr:serine hydrolase [Saprospiraceae bacterium]
MKIVAFLTSLLLVGFTCLLAQNDSNISQQLKTALKEAEQNGWAGSVLVAQNGKILVEEGYGMADREAKKPQTAQTVFSIGSITKQFTAAAIMKLESMGKLSTNDKLSQYFPKAPKDKADITLHQLLTHTAGLPSAIGDDYDNVDATAFADLAFSTPLNNPPGKEYEYSNVGYSLLGIIIEQVSGMGYEQFLRETIWLPAGMTQTGYSFPALRSQTLRWAIATVLDGERQWKNLG